MAKARIKTCTLITGSTVAREHSFKQLVTTRPLFFIAIQFMKLYTINS